MRFTRCLIEPGVEADDLWRSLEMRGIEVVKMDGKVIHPDYREGKRVLRISRHRGRALHHCLSRSSEYCCCNTYVFSHVSNCPFECSYCFLQYYLNDTAVTVHWGLDQLLLEMEEANRAMPWRFLRVGTWELGDSLALEPVLPLAKDFVETFSNIGYAVLELKTKSASVDNLLELDHRGRTIVSWTINTPEVIRKEEHGTASFEERLHAMVTVADAGYLVGIHFDPMICYPGWEEDYPRLVREVLNVVPQDQIAWVSIGSLRFNPEMKGIMELNYPESRAADSEMVLGPDGKMRYVKPLRLAMYRTLLSEIEVNRTAPFLVYFCMERWDVWLRLLEWQPQDIGDLDFHFAMSLYERFPGLVHCKPERELYRKHWDD